MMVRACYMHRKAFAKRPLASLVILTVSGTASDTVRCFSSQTGHLLWEVVASQTDVPRQLYQPPNLGTAIALSGNDLRSGDFYVLIDGRRVQSLARSTGEAKWSWDSEVAGYASFLKWIRSILTLTSAVQHSL